MGFEPPAPHKLQHQSDAIENLKKEDEGINNDDLISANSSVQAGNGRQKKPGWNRPGKHLNNQREQTGFSLLIL